MKQMRSILDSLGVTGSKIDKLFCYTDPATMGILQFTSKAAKFGFLKKHGTTGAQWLNGDRMWWTSNDTVEKRNVDKTLGMIKHELHRSQGTELKDIKIKWSDQIVEVKGHEVATVDDKGIINAKGAAEAVKADVTKYMDAWRDKRGWEESL